MQAAIDTLRIALDNVTTNEPIHRQEGNADQADLCLRQAAELRMGLNLLQDVQGAIKAAIQARAAMPSFAETFAAIFKEIFPTEGNAQTPAKP